MAVGRNSIRTDAIVLRMMNYGEKDRIVGLFSKDFGKVSAFAVSARTSRKRFGAGLDLFSHIHVEMIEPKPGNELWRLHNIQTIDLNMPIRSNLVRLAMASYLAESTWMLAGDADPQHYLYEWWVQALRQLSQSDNLLKLIPYIDISLLKLCGYGPHWGNCMQCRNETNGRQLFFSFDRGGMLCTHCKEGSEGRWLSCTTVKRLEHEEELELKERTDVRRAVHAFLTYVAGREPKSYSFREDVLREYR